MGLRDLFRREPDDMTTKLVEEANAARAQGARKAMSSPAVGASAFSAGAQDWRAQVVAEVEAGRKIAAIKIYRENTGVGLAEAKDAVDRLDAGLPALADAGVAPHLSEADAAVVQLIAKGNLIEAIKAYREIHGTGLAEAKAAVDAMRARGGHQG
jgi:ribosomal protein L7/L12